MVCGILRFYMVTFMTRHDSQLCESVCSWIILKVKFGSCPNLPQCSKILYIWLFCICLSYSTGDTFLAGSILLFCLCAKKCLRLEFCQGCTLLDLITPEVDHSSQKISADLIYGNAVYWNVCCTLCNMFLTAFVRWQLENAWSSQNWIGPIQYFSAEWDRRFSTDPVLTVWTGGRGASHCSCCRRCGGDVVNAYSADWASVHYSVVVCICLLVLM